MFTELSEALFKKCVKILKWKILTDDIEWLFDQMRQGWHVNINLEFYINFSFLFRNSSEGDLIDKILDLADLLCKNCKKHAPFKCLDSVVVTRNNWVSGARVRMSHARGRRRTNTPLGNPALYRLVNSTMMGHSQASQFLVPHSLRTDSTPACISTIADSRHWRYLN